MGADINKDKHRYKEKKVSRDALKSSAGKVIETKQLEFHKLRNKQYQGTDIEIRKERDRDGEQ
jgi:hypothetical protein